jgi:uncharacterized protein YbjQ (UPF0145 family)
MKKALFIAAMILALASCAPTGPQFSQIAGLIDYSQYPGMFLTESNSVSFDYTPVGSLIAVETTGVVAKQTVKEKDMDDIYDNGKGYRNNGKLYYNTYETTKGKVRHADPQSALTYAVDEAKTLGGNGIINLHIRRITDGYEVTGMVIKRK